MSERPYRVVQWATGAMGKAVLRGIIDHPGVELVGVLVYSEKKAGRDAGELARRPETGVVSTTDVDEILALDADVVVHAGRLGPYGSHDADLVRLLESGKNVISINGYSHPHYWAGARLEALEDACRRGGTSLVSAGLNPGFVGEQLAVTATAVCSDLDAVEIVEYADARDVQQAEYLFDVLGFGQDPTGIDPNDVTWGPVSALNGMFEETVAAVAHHLGMRLDEVVTEHQLHVATTDLEVAAGTIPAGTVGHTRWRWVGRAGARRIGLTINWFVETAHLEDPDPPLWEVRVEGQPCLRIAVEATKRPDDRSRMQAEQYAVAGVVLNTIPGLVAAEPGVLTRPAVTAFRADWR